MSINENTKALSELLETVNGLPSYDEVYSEGYEQGKQTESDRMWDIIQNNGEPTQQIFRYPTWTDENFKPKHMVYASASTFTDGVDGKGTRCGMTDIRPETVGVDVDWSICTNFNNCLIHTPIKYVGVIDMTNAQYGGTLFYQAKALESVEKLILPTRAMAFSSLGFAAEKLMQIQFEGHFKANVDMSRAISLNRDSITNAINALSPDVTGCTASFNQTAVNATFTTDDWNALVATKEPNWTITLA